MTSRSKLLDSRQEYSLLDCFDRDYEYILCPVCGYQCNHVRGVVNEGRGQSGGAAILFECESGPPGHRFQLVVDDHKGCCHLRIEATERRVGTYK